MTDAPDDTPKPQPRKRAPRRSGPRSRRKVEAALEEAEAALDEAGDPPAAPASLATLEQAAQFNQAQLAPQSGEVLSSLENPVADQAAVLMLEDLRGYMQGSEQLVLAASGRAMALLLDPVTQETGKKALQELATWQTSLTAFSGSVTDTANTIKGDFS